MLGTGFLGGEQGEDQVHRLVVHGAELHRLLQAHEDAAHAGEPFKPGVRGRDAVAHTGGSGQFTLGEGVEDLAGVEPQVAGRDLGDHRKGLTLARRADAQGDRAAI